MIANILQKLKLDFKMRLPAAGEKKKTAGNAKTPIE